MKSSSIQEQIEKKISLPELIENYLKLEKKGVNYLAICPFHEDRNPSLSISPSKKVWKCFVCNVGGGGIKFVMLFLNLNYRQAVQEIATKFDLTLPPDWIQAKTITEEEEKLAKVNQEAQLFFQMKLSKELEGATMVKNFCQKRKISQEIIDRFQLGWIDKADQELWNYCLKKGVSSETLLTSGLFIVQKQRKTEKIKNFFREQLLFPIYNQNNLLAGFSGRRIEDSSSSQLGKLPKYFNSPENVLFQKKTLLYNWNLVKKSFPTSQKVYLVEGIMDAIRLTVNNFPALALMGTTLGKEQIALIKERFLEVTIFPDPDKPGITSALKNSLLLLNSGIKAKIVTLVTHLDPDLALQSDDFDLTKVKKLKPAFFLLEQYSAQAIVQHFDEIIISLKKFFPFLSLMEKHQTIQTLATKTQISHQKIAAEIGWKEGEERPKKDNLTLSSQVKSKPKWKEYLFENLLLNLELMTRIGEIDGSFDDLEYNYYYQYLVEWYNREKTNKNNLTWKNYLLFLKEKEQKVVEWFMKTYQASKKKYENGQFNEKILESLIKKFILSKYQEEITELVATIENVTPKQQVAIWKKIEEKRNKMNDLKKNVKD